MWSGRGVPVAIPARAYTEAIELASTHQSSYGREAASVFAAAVAQAMIPGASVSSVVDTCLRLAKDGHQDRDRGRLRPGGRAHGAHWCR